MLMIPRSRLVVSKLGTSKSCLIDNGSKCDCLQQSLCGMLSPDDSGKQRRHIWLQKHPLKSAVLAR
jgi:hypothetical protein